MSATLTVVGVPSGSTHDFGTVASGAMVSHQFNLRNTGLSDLEINTLEISGEGFSIDPGDDPSKAILGPGNTSTVTVLAQFAGSGTKTGQLQIPSNDPASPYIINLAATVPAPPNPSSMRAIRVVRAARSCR